MSSHQHNQVAFSDDFIDLVLNSEDLTPFAPTPVVRNDFKDYNFQLSKNPQAKIAIKTEVGTSKNYNPDESDNFKPDITDILKAAPTEEGTGTTTLSTQHKKITTTIKNVNIKKAFQKKYSSDELKIIVKKFKTYLTQCQDPEEKRERRVNFLFPVLYAYFSKICCGSIVELYCDKVLKKQFSYQLNNWLEKIHQVCVSKKLIVLLFNYVIRKLQQDWLHHEVRYVYRLFNNELGWDFNIERPIEHEKEYKNLLMFLDNSNNGCNSKKKSCLTNKRFIKYRIKELGRSKKIVVSDYANVFFKFYNIRDIRLKQIYIEKIEEEFKKELKEL